MSRQQLKKALAALKMRQDFNENAKQTVFGLYRPSPDHDPDNPIHVKNLAWNGYEWAETTEPHNATLPEAFEPVLKSRKRFIVIIGGRGSGKSESLGFILNADVNDYGAKVMNLREFQSAIKYSVHPLLAAKIDEAEYSGFIVQKDEIKHVNGGGHVFLGMARNPDSVKSAYGFNRFWGEEAQTFSQESLLKLTPTMRKAGGRMYFTANPGSSEDPFSQRFIVQFQDALDAYGIYEDDEHLILVVNYDKNPWFPAALRAEMEGDRKRLGKALFAHVWLGKYSDEIPDCIIDADTFDLCVNAHKVLNFEPTGRKIVALDPADVGADNKALIMRHGSVVTRVESWYEGDANAAADRLVGTAKANGATVVMWDIAGLGAGLRRDITQPYSGAPGVIVEGYNAGSGVLNPTAPVELDRWLNKEAEGKNALSNQDIFANRGSQDIYELRRRMERTAQAVAAKLRGEEPTFNPDELISFDRDAFRHGDEDLFSKFRAELCRIPRIYNANGKFSRMSKPEMRRKLKLKSPGMADALIMTMNPSQPVRAKDYSNFKIPSNY